MGFIKMYLYHPDETGKILNTKNEKALRLFAT